VGGSWWLLLVTAGCLVVSMVPAYEVQFDEMDG
jgi:hypothetical protein